MPKLFEDTKCAGCGKVTSQEVVGKKLDDKMAPDEKGSQKAVRCTICGGFNNRAAKGKRKKTKIANKTVADGGD